MKAKKVIGKAVKVAIKAKAKKPTAGVGSMKPGDGKKSLALKAKMLEKKTF